MKDRGQHVNNYVGAENGVSAGRRRVGGGASQIAVLDLATGERRRLAAQAGADDHSARPSPTRDEVAFVSTRSGRPQIHIAQLDGEGVRRLADIPGSTFAPRWSPGGERLAVTWAPPGADEPRLADQDSLEGARVVVLDRDVRLPGFPAT